MKITDAIWEKHNLGVIALEIEIDSSDSFSHLSNLITLHNYDYVIIKVPIRLLSFAHALEDMGFRFMETQVALSRDLHVASNFSTGFNFLLQKIEVKQANDNDHLEKILSRIDISMFATDRISMDPLFGPQVGMERYKNWIKQEVIKEGSILAELSLNKKSIGFYLLSKLENGAYFSTLAGIYSEFRGKGLGISAVAKPLECVIELGGRWVHTRNSTNNLESLKLHLTCGYSIKEMFYIFRWLRVDAISKIK